MREKNILKPIYKRIAVIYNLELQYLTNVKNTLKEPSNIFLDICLYSQLQFPEKASQQFEMYGFPNIDQLEAQKLRLKNKYIDLNYDVLYQDINIELQNKCIEEELKHDNERLNECELIDENNVFSNKQDYIGVFKDKILINQHYSVDTLKFVDHFQKTELSLENCSSIKFDRTPTSITDLILFGCHVNELEGIQNMKQLTSLEISEGLSSFNLSPLKFLINLTSLTLSAKMTNLDALRNLVKLTFLSLSNGDFVDVYPLQKLVNLKILSLRNNKILDIYALSLLNQLQTLDLRFNTIIDISPLKKLQNLTSLNIELNRIKDFDPIKELNITNLKQYQAMFIEPSQDILDQLFVKKQIFGAHEQIVQIKIQNRKLKNQLQRLKQQMYQAVQRAFHDMISFTGAVSRLFQ
ncbi:Conserved_hypothetical protein [Hexamita inflata]|uniref:Uncharacterized protein n=1 Tax=Hexamita inflata TaxID=28002 RepID=A0AA86RS73_9EUKA|nr:Conserved hypothetical protein [Hexamita inflata]